MTESASALVDQLAALLDAPIVEHNAPEIPETGYVIERVGSSAHVLHEGATVGLAEEDPLTFSLTLEARWEATTPHDEADAAELVMAELRQPWEARGWTVDEDCDPANGWQAEERSFIFNIIKDVETVAQLAQEVHFAVDEGTVAWIEDVADGAEAAE